MLPSWNKGAWRVVQVAAVPQASDNQVRLGAVYGQPVDFAPLVTNKTKVECCLSSVAPSAAWAGAVIMAFTG
jgi:hypothetical protein